MKYVVLKEFKDRYDNDRHCHPGEPHTPPNEERANQLIQLGFIKAVTEAPTPSDEDQQRQENPKSYDEVTAETPKKRGRRKKDAGVEADGDPDGQAPSDE